MLLPPLDPRIHPFIRILIALRTAQSLLVTIIRPLSTARGPILPFAIHLKHSRAEIGKRWPRWRQGRRRTAEPQILDRGGLGWIYKFERAVFPFSAAGSQQRRQGSGGL